MGVVRISSTFMPALAAISCCMPFRMAASTAALTPGPAILPSGFSADAFFTASVNPSDGAAPWDGAAPGVVAAASSPAGSAAARGETIDAAIRLAASRRASERRGEKWGLVM